MSNANGVSTVLKTNRYSEDEHYVDIVAAR